MATQEQKVEISDMPELEEDNASPLKEKETLPSKPFRWADFIIERSCNCPACEKEKKEQEKIPLKQSSSTLPNDEDSPKMINLDEFMAKWGNNKDTILKILNLASPPSFKDRYPTFEKFCENYHCICQLTPKNEALFIVKEKNEKSKNTYSFNAMIDDWLARNGYIHIFQRFYLTLVYENE